MNEFVAALVGALVSAIVGAGIFAAGAYFRHRVIRPEPPVIPPREGNPWAINAGGEAS